MAFQRETTPRGTAVIASRLSPCLCQKRSIGSFTVESWEECFDRDRAIEAIAGYRSFVCSFRAFPPFHSPSALQSGLGALPSSTKSQSFLETITSSLQHLRVSSRCSPPPLKGEVDASQSTLKGLSPHLRHFEILIEKNSNQV